ncbi:hypothetical protein [Desulfocurvus sp. DL9XJH121]
MAKATATGRKRTGKAARPAPLPTYLGLVEEVRQRQIMEGNFDCFGRAQSGFCDQANCFYRQECLDISKKMDA